MIRNCTMEKTKIGGVMLIDPFVADDERGLFIKDYSQELFERNGISHPLKEVFYTVSHKGVIRAIHFQRKHLQAKLVRCITGRIYDIVVDLKKDSPTFGAWQGFELSGENRMELYIPGHCGHGYLVLEPSVVSYKCDEKFYSEYDDGILWNDPDIHIEWPLSLVDKLIVSKKDQNLQSLLEFQHLYGGL